jgi:hypothetical protein
MSNEQKTPLARTLPNYVTDRVRKEIAKLGYALPGHVTDVEGAIVTVNLDVTGATFPQVTMPIFGAEYIRLPVQVNDKGVCFPCSVYLGGISGLGSEGSTADLTTPQGNLSNLVWFPIGNKNWTLPTGANANTLAMYGKMALLLLDSFAANASVKLTSSGITLTFGSASITMNSSGITLTVGSHSIVISSSNITIDGKVFLTHEHLPGTYVAGSTAVTGDSGAVV